MSFRRIYEKNGQKEKPRQGFVSGIAMLLENRIQNDRLTSRRERYEGVRPEKRYERMSPDGKVRREAHGRPIAGLPPEFHRTDRKRRNGMRSGCETTDIPRSARAIRVRSRIRTTVFSDTPARTIPYEPYRPLPTIFRNRPTSLPPSRAVLIRDSRSSAFASRNLPAARGRTPDTESPFRRKEFHAMKPKALKIRRSVQQSRQ